MKVQKDWQGKPSADNNTKHHAHLATFEFFYFYLASVFLMSFFFLFHFSLLRRLLYVQREEDFLWEISDFLMQRIAHNFEMGF